MCNGCRSEWMGEANTERGVGRAAVMLRLGDSPIAAPPLLIWHILRSAALSLRTLFLSQEQLGSSSRGAPEPSAQGTTHRQSRQTARQQRSSSRDGPSRIAGAASRAAGQVRAGYRAHASARQVCHAATAGARAASSQHPLPSAAALTCCVLCPHPPTPLAPSLQSTHVQQPGGALFP